MLLLLTEAYRHGEPLGGWNGADRLLAPAGIALADGAAHALDAVAAVLAPHRARDRFPPAT
ncbi:hypothetical protein [Streptomyces erythrochromogenes]|uniref:hypothetical protein n=1 Tax=Streptomyces erythrochromogenes TaxID=285574 RepID=UPI0036A6A8BC